MSEEIKKSEEDEKEKVVTESETDEKKSDEKEDFEKDSETVPSSKYNQAVRKQREYEAKQKELEKELAELKAGKKDDSEEKSEEEDEEEEAPKTSKLVDEKLAPILESLKKRDNNDKQLARTAFFDTHKEYLNDSEKWQELLDEMDKSLNPNSGDSYYEQLEKAHRIISGDSSNADIEKKVTEMAKDAGAGGGEAEKVTATDEFTAEEKANMKQFNISPEGMRAFKKKQSEGLANVM